MSLSVEDTENEQNEIRRLQGQLEETNTLVRTLSMQLTELRDQVSLHCIHGNLYSHIARDYGT